MKNEKQAGFKFRGIVGAGELFSKEAWAANTDASGNFQAGAAGGNVMTEARKVATQVRARNASCDCPHCGAELDGWAVDPRGRETTCDECKQPFTIAPDASVSIT